MQQWAPRFLQMHVSELVHQLGAVDRRAVLVDKTMIENSTHLLAGADWSLRNHE